MVVAPQAEVVALLTRAPSAGGKTRLFQSLGISPDPVLVTALLLDTLDGVSSVGVGRIVFVEPPVACDEVRALVPADVRVMGQVQGSLGDRMRAVFETLLGEGSARVVIIGSDLPTITMKPIDDAFQALRRDQHTVALGPTPDGGYYLIGASKTPDVFDQIEWSSARVFEQTCDAAVARGLRVAQVSGLDDVDTAVDLDRLITNGSVRARRTIGWARMRGRCDSGK